MVTFVVLLGVNTEHPLQQELKYVGQSANAARRITNKLKSQYEGKPMFIVNQMWEDGGIVDAKIKNLL